MKRCQDLIDLLHGDGSVFIRTRDFPDHDSVASAYGLQQLLKTNGIGAAIT